MNLLKDNIKYKLLFLCLAVYIITSINSIGFYHSDEHFQILEFAMSKINPDDNTNLAWEYNAQIRPTLQPVIALIVIKSLSFIGLESPYFQAFFLRFITALLAFFLIKSFAQDKKNFLTTKERYVYLLFAFLLWFIPFVSVRFSSESWSGLFFFWALLQYNKQERANSWIVGALLGVSFLFRFQIAFAIIGLGCWMLIINKERFLFVLKMFFSFCVILLLGIVLDSWFYGNFVFTPWNYFYFNIVKDVASTFGTEPIDYYLSRTLFEPTVLIGLTIALGMFILVLKNRRSVYLWILVPYLFFHSIVPHKEFRFMYPMVYLIVPMLLEAYLILKGRIRRQWERIGKVYIYIVGLINILAICVVMIKPPGAGYVALAHCVYMKYADKDIDVYYNSWANPFVYGNDLNMSFYNEPQLSNHYIDSLEEINIVKDSHSVDLLFYKLQPEQDFDEICKTIEKIGFKYVRSGCPLWYYNFAERFRRIQNPDRLLLYERM